ncbi:ABC-ATPase domain-containing protein [Anaerostipes sp.]|uniref:ABC-ATPase domain-containing protein n=1 Tax=Anaerostipes sp. TaxID=1872530 RepID=UPI0025C53712|nr:ABC-ATPase domain-containing protein [Anaerostipes sp.]MBS7006851.1 ABC-ATPase domain-containing protein [Anaerostipes sp.]
MKTSDDLKSLLQRIDHKGYPAYKDTRGSYRFDGYVLNIDHVQGDPFASPSKLSAVIPGAKAGFPPSLFDLPHKRTALQDHLTRLFGRKLESYNFKAKGSGKSGLISVSRCGQEILSRTALSIHPSTGDLSVHFEVGFPARGRTIAAFELIKILFDFLPECIHSSFYYNRLNSRVIKDVADLAEDQQYIREQLPKLGLCAFVADGSILPRESGVSSRPMKKAVPFHSPESLKITLDLPHHGPLAGMGIPRGITLIVGGGYHGKSTLLKALELGVYNHIKNDGREYVITDNTAVKLRAEDGRSIKNTDISLFINNLPNGKDTSSFSTEDASGSTSQAANVVESMEAGTSLFLIDEDTSATNFMIRDELMQRVVHRNHEPITPFIEQVQGLYEDHGISSIIVAGSSGAYFQVADHILQMDRYVPKEITSFAKEKAKAFPSVTLPDEKPAKPSFRRIIRSHPSFAKNGRNKLKTLGKDAFQINKETVDLRYAEQLCDSEQTAALGYALLYAQLHLIDGQKDLCQIVGELMQMIETKGLASILDCGYVKSNLAEPRRQEIFAAFNRYRNL